MESDWKDWLQEYHKPLKFGYPIELGLHEKEAEVLIGYLALVDIPELAICVKRLREELRIAKRFR